MPAPVVQGNHVTQRLVLVGPSHFTVVKHWYADVRQSDWSSLGSSPCTNPRSTAKGCVEGVGVGHKYWTQ
jgi:hypothetical protein